jgi:hypothetical protein
MNFDAKIIYFYFISFYIGHKNYRLQGECPMGVSAKFQNKGWILRTIMLHKRYTLFNVEVTTEDRFIHQNKVSKFSIQF